MKVEDKLGLNLSEEGCSSREEGGRVPASGNLKEGSEFSKHFRRNVVKTYLWQRFTAVSVHPWFSVHQEGHMLFWWMRVCSPLWCYFNCEAYIIPHLVFWGVPVRHTLLSEVVSQTLASTMGQACLNVSKSCPSFCPVLLPFSHRSAYSRPCVQSDQLTCKSGRSLTFSCRHYLFFSNLYQCT